MSTRARIALAMTNGKFKSIYVHKDGYPEGVGSMLVQHYGTAPKVQALLKLGDISRLGPALSPSAQQSHSFCSPALGVTVAYKRDRGDKETAALTSINFTALAAAAADCNAEYIYALAANRWLFTPIPWINGVAMPVELDLREVAQ
jgi:hypothetical protein